MGGGHSKKTESEQDVPARKDDGLVETAYGTVSEKVSVDQIKDLFSSVPHDDEINAYNEKNSDERLKFAENIICSTTRAHISDYHETMTDKQVDFWEARGTAAIQYKEWSKFEKPKVFISYTGWYANHEKWKYKISYARLKGWVVYDSLYLDGADCPIWIDKACMSQKQEHLVWLSRNEYFFRENIHLVSKVLVIMHDCYLTRLWCLVEWCNAIVKKDPIDIIVGFTPFLDVNPTPEEYFKSFCNSITGISLATAGCQLEADRAVLKNTIDESFNSIADFELFAKCSAVLFIARILLRNHYYSTKFLPPLIVTAQKCCPPEIIRCITIGDEIKPKTGYGTPEWGDEWETTKTNWFREVCQPELLKIKERSLRVN